jgi:hypothetical protein
MTTWTRNVTSPQNQRNDLWASDSLGTSQNVVPLYFRAKTFEKALDHRLLDI